MRRTAVRVVVSVGLLAVTLATASGARAAGEVVVAVSPSAVGVGEPVEVLLRTFVPIQREGVLPGTKPREPFPAPSAFWNLLYPWDDYPFDVVAQHEGDTDVPVKLARDPSDSTLWRGFVSLPKAGTWTIWVRNFPRKEPGSTTVVTVRSGPPAATVPPAISNATTTTTGVTSIEASPAALAGVLVGLVAGALLARALRRRRAA